ncbi:P-loop containing nucleoside triphosphate hydrolase protein, partial [Lentinula edodes]
GGTGKTQLVLEFAKQNHYRFSNIWFFDATSDASLIADFKELGRAAGVGEDPKKVQAFLESKFQNFLCIFDNADDKKVDLKKYIPRGKNCNVIITSRILEIAQVASPGCCVAVSDLYKEDAITLLLGHAHIADSDTNREQGSKIVDALNCHALAVSSAGAYMQAFKTCTLSDYLSVLNSKKKELFEYQMKSLDGYSKSVYSAFILSFEKLSTQAKHLLQMCSFLHHTAIPVQLFVNAAADD